MKDDLITNNAFIPEIGKCYELHYGEITYKGTKGNVSAKVKINGTLHQEWADLDSNARLDPELSVYVVQAYKEIPC